MLFDICLISFSLKFGYEGKEIPLEYKFIEFFKIFVWRFIHIQLIHWFKYWPSFNIIFL